MDYTATQKEKSQNNNECSSGCKDRPTQCLIDAGIHDFFKRSPPKTLQVFPDPVKDNNSIIERIAHNSKDCGYNGEGELLVKKGKSPDSNRNIMDKCNNGAQGIFQLQKPAECDSNNHGNHDEPGNAHA